MEETESSTSGILEDKETLLEEIESLAEKAQENYKEKFKAAILIQSYVRGHLVREHIKNLESFAAVIQNVFKGFKARIGIHQKLTVGVEKNRNQMATMIQKTWRGYYSRRSRFNYKGLQCWLNQVKTENVLVEQKLEQFNAETAEKYSKSRQKYWNYIRSRLHHLLRTQNIPGVFSCLHSNQLSQIEQCLKNVKYFSRSTDGKQRHNHQSSNGKNLRDTWHSLTNMPQDEFPRCLYDPNWSSCKGFTEDSTPKDDRLSNDGIDEAERSDRIWKERIAMLEKDRPICISQEECVMDTSATCPAMTEKDNCYVYK